MTASASGARPRHSGFRNCQIAIWLIAVFVLLTLGLQLWPGASGFLRFYRPDYERGAVWQLLTSQWVHLSRWHAAGNVFAFLVLVYASGFWLRWPLQMLALCGGYIGVALVVAFDPDCSYYAGASGALHGLLAGNAVALVWASYLLKQPASGHRLALAGLSSHVVRHIAMAVLGLLAFKLWLQADKAGAAHNIEWGFPVYYPAHIAGALGGMSLVLLILSARAWTASKAQTERRQ